MAGEPVLPARLQLLERLGGERRPHQREAAARRRPRGHRHRTPPLPRRPRGARGQGGAPPVLPEDAVPVVPGRVPQGGPLLPRVRREARLRERAAQAHLRVLRHRGDAARPLLQRLRRPDRARRREDRRAEAPRLDRGRSSTSPSGKAGRGRGSRRAAPAASPLAGGRVRRARDKTADPGARPGEADRSEAGRLCRGGFGAARLAAARRLQPRPRGKGCVSQTGRARRKRHDPERSRGPEVPGLDRSARSGDRLRALRPGEASAGTAKSQAVVRPPAPFGVRVLSGLADGLVLGAAQALVLAPVLYYWPGREVQGVRREFPSCRSCWP